MGLAGGSGGEAGQVTVRSVMVREGVRLWARWLVGRNREHATMIVEREARADCFWVLQASAGVVHGLHGVLLLPCGPRAWARAAARSLFFVGKPHMSDLGVVKPVSYRSGVCGVKAMRGPGGLPTTARTPLAFT